LAGGEVTAVKRVNVRYEGLEGSLREACGSLYVCGRYGEIIHCHTVTGVVTNPIARGYFGYPHRI
jgi:hypothetical protein